MREILFKAKRIDTGEWVEGYYYYCNVDCSHIILVNVSCPPSWSEPGGENYNKRYDVHPETVCQYTCLLDKNGKKIFEKDVVQGEFSVKVGEYTRTVGRRSLRFDDYKKRTIQCVVNFVNGTYMANSDFKEYYNTGFWAGCGRTKAEKEANRSVQTCTTFNRSLSEVYKEIEIIGNVHDEVRR